MQRNRRRTIADWCAGALAVIVLVAGGLVVIKPAVDHSDDLYRANPFAVGTTTQKVRERRTAKATRTTTTTTESSSSFAERLMGKSGVVLFRLCLVALVAFLAGALVHRAILGSYGFRSAPVGARAPVAAPSEHVSNGTLPSAQEPEVAADAAQEPNGASLAPGIAKLVASRREVLGLSQRELAKKAGVSHTVISRIEGGEHSPSPKTLERLADALV
jgi:DNA-binding XRE family transcriptional regulator